MKRTVVVLSVLVVLLVGYVINDRIMSWDANQVYVGCRDVPIETIVDCWDARDIWPVDF